MMNLTQTETYLRQLQQSIVAAFEKIDGGTFTQDAWLRPEGGEGLTCIIENGQVFERAGIGFSHVTGGALPASATANRPELVGAPFEVLGVSLVVHPRNPHVPTVHMNIRLFIAQPADHAAIWWFGGGMDLTPYYGFEEDAQHFHQVCYDALAPYSAKFYPEFKKQCDDYFYLKHRQEPRGIGGIFFDDFNCLPFEETHTIWQQVGDAFLAAYLPIVERRLTIAYTEQQRAFQAYRRGRYVEFNLVWDRGTHFGLQSGGRTESILLSMPPQACWAYQYQAEPHSAEAELTDYYLTARDWLNIHSSNES